MCACGVGWEMVDGGRASQTKGAGWGGFLGGRWAGSTCNSRPGAARSAWPGRLLGHLRAEALKPAETRASGGGEREPSNQGTSVDGGKC